MARQRYRKSIQKECQQCFVLFRVKISVLDLGKGKFCSKKCTYESFKRYGHPQSLETKQKISETRLERKIKHTEEAKKKISEFNKTRSKEHYQKIGLKGVLKQQSNKNPTSIEKAVYDYLLLKGILFEKQKLINEKFLVDAYIPSLNLIIEADGNYWHSLDKVMKKDKAENAYLTKCGFNLIRLSETEIKDGTFKERMVV